jgi:hypothetical protein
MLSSTKECARCHRELPRTEAFYHRAGKWFQGACKACVCARTAAWVAAHPERARVNSLASAKRARKANPHKYHTKDRAFDLKRKYGLTIEDYNRMLSAQNGVCAICKRPPTGKHRLAVDHCHTTNRNRGLLCAPCNTALNRLEAVANWAEKAASYLTGSKEIS